MRNRKELKEASWGLMQGLVLIADVTGTNKLFCVLLHGGPSEPLLQDVSGSLDAWMAGQLGGVSPLEDI